MSDLSLGSAAPRPTSDRSHASNRTVASLSGELERALDMADRNDDEGRHSGGRRVSWGRRRPGLCWVVLGGRAGGGEGVGWLGGDGGRGRLFGVGGGPSFDYNRPPKNHQRTPLARPHTPPPSAPKSPAPFTLRTATTMTMISKRSRECGDDTCVIRAGGGGRSSEASRNHGPASATSTTTRPSSHDSDAPPPASPWLSSWLLSPRT